MFEFLTRSARISTIDPVRVIAYLRVPKGADDTDSLYGQREAVRGWARRSGATILATFEDTEEEDRPGLRALVRSLSGEIDAVLVAHLGALSGDIVLQEILLERIRRTGVGVIPVDTHDQSSVDHTSRDAMRQIVRTVLHRHRRVDAMLDAREELEPEPSALVLEIVDDRPTAAAG